MTAGGRGSTLPLPVRIFGWLALLAGALTLVIWRQGVGIDLEERVVSLHEDAAVLDAERIDLLREVERLHSRERILRISRDRLDLRLPQDDEVVILMVPGQAGPFDRSGR